MAKKSPRPKRDNPEQSERFIKAAKTHEADEGPKAMDRAFKAVIPSKSKDRRSGT